MMLAARTLIAGAFFITLDGYEVPPPLAIARTRFCTHQTRILLLCLEVWHGGLCYWH